MTDEPYDDETAAASAAAEEEAEPQPSTAHDPDATETPRGNVHSEEAVDGEEGDSPSPPDMPPPHGF